jgi:hypothetical protein
MKITTNYYGDVYVWPFIPRYPFREALEWYTDLSESHVGGDSTAKFRNAPRLSFEIESTIPEDRIADTYINIYKGVASQWAVPYWPEREKISISAGATTLDSNYNLEPTSLAIIWQSSSRWEVVEVDSDYDISEVQESYYGAWIIPLRVGKMTPSPRFSQDTTRGLFSFFFRSDYNYEKDTDPLTQYNGYDFYDDDCLLMDNDGLVDSIVRRMDIMDNVTGAVSTYSPWDCTRRERQYRVLTQSRDSYKEFINFLYRRSGRYKPFWMPTAYEDLSLVSTGVLGSTISVELIETDECRNHIAIKANDQWYPFEIDSVVDGTNTNLFLTESVGIDAADVQKISYLGLHRLNTDRVEIEHLAGEQAQAAFPIMEVKFRD